MAIKSARRARSTAVPEDPPGWLSATSQRYLAAAFRAVLFAYACVAAFPVRYHAAGTGLDPSWAFALNFAHARGLLFGRDAGCTYGPLAYLVLPMPVGRNLAAGILFQVLAWTGFILLLGWFVWCRRIRTLPLLLFTAALVLGADSFWVFGYAGGDTFLVFLLLLLLAAALVARRWWLFYGSALAVGALLFFVKFSSAIGGIAAAGLFAAALWLCDRRKAWPATLGLLAWPLAVFAIGCGALQPSPAALGRYLRLGLDISSGYSAAMSAYGPPDRLWNALWILAAWLVLAAVLYWRKSAAWPLAAASVAPLFLEFKHSFVREAGHVGIVFLFLPLLWAAVALVGEYRRRDAWFLAALALPALAWYPAGTPWLSRLWHPGAALQRASNLAEIVRFPDLQRRLRAQSAQALAADRLPPPLLSRVGARSLAPFPSECAYAAANPLDMRLFPTFQMYQAYTPSLDGLNAAYLEDARRAPAFVLFDWDAIDERHPLLDVPATALALYRQYDLDGVYGEHLLLRRRAAPRFGAWQVLDTRQWRLDRPLRVPPGDRPLGARIFLRWNDRGRLRNFLWRLPEVRLVASSVSGRVWNVRVPAAVLADGVPLNFLPFDRDQARALFAGAAPPPLEAISIGGPGAAYLEPSARVEIVQAPGERLSYTAPAPPDFARLPHLGSLDSWRIEMMNDTGAAGFSRLTVPDTRGYLQALGWAVVDGNPAGGLWMELDGVPQPALYGTPRPDIAALFHGAPACPCGFTWTVPAWKLGKGWHDLSLRILSRDGAAWYDGGRRLHFRME